VTAIQEWDESFHRLKFVFGEYCFYTARFEAAELTTHVSRLNISLKEITASAVPLLERYGAVAIPAHPICADPEWLMITRNYLRYVPTVTDYYFIDSDMSFDEYVRRMPRKARHELRRKLRRFVTHSGGKVDLRTYRTLPEAQMFVGFAWAVSRKTYQHRLLDVGLPDSAQFRAELLERASRDAMRGYVLFHQDTAIAYAYSTAKGDCLQFHSIGYDPSWRDLSPGIVLMYEALHSAMGERRFAIIDFGFGEARYKREFATGSLRCATTFFFRRTTRHLATILAHRACIVTSDCFATLANRLGIKTRLKQYFRTRTAGFAGMRLRNSALMPPRGGFKE
jgi:CelD/BcsL family acetyltransferase involved in cellulose biosynthesis